VCLAWKGKSKHPEGERTHETTVEYPPFSLAIALLAMVFAGPTWVQTITAPGLKGPNACAGQGETTDPIGGSVSSITATSATVVGNAHSNLYGTLRARAGDGGTTSFRIRYHIRNARTNASVKSATSGSITADNPNLNQIILSRTSTGMNGQRKGPEIMS